MIVYNNCLQAGDASAPTKEKTLTQSLMGEAAFWIVNLQFTLLMNACPWPASVCTEPSPTMLSKQLLAAVQEELAISIAYPLAGSSNKSEFELDLISDLPCKVRVDVNSV